MIFRLIHMNGLRKGERITISRDPMTIGRDDTCAVQISDDPEVAGEHCTMIHTDSDELVIRDSGSMNKVLVNSHETTNAKLKHGDMIEIGRTRFLVQAFVQADVKGSGDLQTASRKRKTSLAPMFLLLTVAAAIGLIVMKANQNHSDANPITKEAIPPTIFKDIKATDPEPATPPAAKTEPVTKTQPVAKTEPVTKTEPPVKPEQDTKPEQDAKPASADKPKEPAPTPIKDQEPKEKPPAPIVIVSLDQQKFPQKPEYDEMRVASLKLRTTGSVVEDSKVAIRFEFFDRDLTTGEITPARAIVPTKALTTQMLASTGEETVTAAYTVPKGLRTAPSAESGRTFYGLRVKVMYAGELVAQKAVPNALLDKE